MNRQHTTMILAFALGYIIVACGPVPTPKMPTLNPSATETPPPPPANMPTLALAATETPPPPPLTSTVAPTATDTPEPTVTPTPTVASVPGDFEESEEDWGNYGKRVEKLADVDQYCDTAIPIKHTGNCSLKYNPTIPNKNVYVARYANSDDAKTLISVWVYVPSDALCSTSGCSTARVIVWDGDYKSHEGDEVELDRVNEWVEISIDLRGEAFPEPYKAIGVHFYLATQYAGPFYIDTVTTTKR